MKKPIKIAKYFEKQNDESIKCTLCPHFCIINRDSIGMCKVRKNIDGELFTLNYGKVASYGKDPIEKKPLYHFYPGESIFSIGSYGCNFTCDFCQNFNISQEVPSIIETPASNLVDIAVNEKNNIGVAYTYSEPTVWYEYMYDIAKAIRGTGLKNVIVTNGYINPEPLSEILPIIDAMNIDLKSMNNDFYKKYCGGKVEPILEAIKLASCHTHVEVTTLIIEGLNSSVEDIEKVAKWIGSINDNIPLHLSRYFPNYKMKIPATDIYILTKLSEVAKKYLKYVYVGNVWDVDRNTNCPKCGEILIDRSTLIKVNTINGGKCSNCGYESNIITRL